MSKPKLNISCKDRLCEDINIICPYGGRGEGSRLLKNQSEREKYRIFLEDNIEVFVINLIISQDNLK